METESSPQGAPSVSVDRRELLRIEGHDLRSPLANIRSYAGMILSKRGPPIDPKVRRAAEIIVKNADRGLALVEDWIDWRLLREGLLELERMKVPLSSPLQLALGEVVDEAAAAGVGLSPADASGLPMVEAAAADLQRIIRALLLAAIRRTPAGGLVEIHAQESEDRICLFFDAGGGPLPEEEVPLAFDRSYQTLASRKLGVGLSLALAKGLAEAYDGQVGVRPTPRGCSYFLALPTA